MSPNLSNSVRSSSLVQRSSSASLYDDNKDKNHAEQMNSKLISNDAISMEEKSLQRSIVRSQLTTFFHKYAPSQLNMINHQMSVCKNNYDQLFEDLQRQYGHSPNECPIPTHLLDQLDDLQTRKKGKPNGAKEVNGVYNGRRSKNSTTQNKPKPRNNQNIEKTSTTMNSSSSTRSSSSTSPYTKRAAEASSLRRSFNRNSANHETTITSDIKISGQEKTKTTNDHLGQNAQQNQNVKDNNNTVIGKRRQSDEMKGRIAFFEKQKKEKEERNNQTKVVQAPPLPMSFPLPPNRQSPSFSNNRESPHDSPSFQLSMAGTDTLIDSNANNNVMSSSLRRTTVKNAGTSQVVVVPSFEQWTTDFSDIQRIEKGNLQKKKDANSLQQQRQIESLRQSGQQYSQSPPVLPPKPLNIISNGMQNENLHFKGQRSSTADHLSNAAAIPGAGSGMVPLGFVEQQQNKQKNNKPSLHHRTHSSAKRELKGALRYKELIETEKTYLEFLHTVVDVFLTPLETVLLSNRGIKTFDHLHRETNQQPNNNPGFIIQQSNNAGSIQPINVTRTTGGNGAGEKSSLGSLSSTVADELAVLDRISIKRPSDNHHSLNAANYNGISTTLSGQHNLGNNNTNSISTPITGVVGSQPKPYFKNERESDNLLLNNSSQMMISHTESTTSISNTSMRTNSFSNTHDTNPSGTPSPNPFLNHPQNNSSVRTSASNDSLLSGIGTASSSYYLENNGTRTSAASSSMAVGSSILQAPKMSKLAAVLGPGTPPPILSLSTIDALFSNIKSILQLNNELFHGLCQCAVFEEEDQRLKQAAGSSAKAAGSLAESNEEDITFDLLGMGLHSSTNNNNINSPSSGTEQPKQQPLEQHSLNVDCAVGHLIALDWAKVAECFVSLAEYFKLYSLYSSNFENARSVLKDLMKRNQGFIAFVKQQQQFYPKRMKNQDLVSLLIKPIQRICKYPLFLKEALKTCKKGTNEFKVLSSALHAMEGVNTVVNLKMKEREAVNNVVSFYNLLNGTCPDLVAPHRKFMRQMDVEASHS
eukprot:g1467.t1